MSCALPDAPSVNEVFKEQGARRGLSRTAFEAKLGQGVALRRLPRLAEIGHAAVPTASHLTSARTVAPLNVTCGNVRS